MRMGWIVILGLVFLGANPVGAAEPYLVGRAITDVTGPPVGLPMLGFVRQDQIAEGIHTRQYARAFAIAQPDGQRRVAFAIVDVGLLSYTLKLEVLERIEERLGKRYDHDNFVLAATHTHAAVGGFFHHLAASPLGGGFCQTYFDALAEGIAEAVVEADADLKPGRILLAQGRVEQAGVNRSLPAYENNPADERARYAEDTDKTMTLLKLVRGDEEIGTINWFATHPTSMNFFNKLISGDNKGYASYQFEMSRGTDYRQPAGFVAAFANSNCGDVTPNLNLDNTGPGQTDTESTAIIGQRQFEAARDLYDQASQSLEGPIRYAHGFVDMSKLVVTDEFTGMGDRQLCASAVGYSMAAGSTEDGGGHPLFREGMTKPNPLIEGIVQSMRAAPLPNEEFRNCHLPKPILLATGLAKPPLHEQVITLGIIQIGPLVVVAASGELTTMVGRRLREAVGQTLEVDPELVVLACYANCFSGYTTTYEEYQTQQYEGGHTLFGPWTEAGQRQEFVRLARALKSGESYVSNGRPEDMRPRVENTWREVEEELEPVGANWGAVVEQPQASYQPGGQVVATFWTGSPVHDYRRGDRYVEIQQTLSDRSDQWQTIADEGDWATTVRWQQIILDENGQPVPPAKFDPYSLERREPVVRPEPYQVTVTWNIPEDAPPGQYRIVHHGRHKQSGRVQRFTASSQTFVVQP